VEKRATGKGRATEYHLTRAGQELQGVINALLNWGAQWAFGEPTPEDLDPLLLMWWMRDRVYVDRLPQARVVVQFDFSGVEASRFWLVLARDDVSVCLNHPGYDIDVLVTAELSALLQVWLGRLSYAEALRAGKVKVDGPPALVHAFPCWFALSLAAPAVRAAISLPAS
jgi:putative sterol carrier protein